MPKIGSLDHLTLRDTEWAEIISHGKFADVETPQIYLARLSESIGEAWEFVQKIESGPWLSVKEIAQIHKILFKRIAPWAGKFRDTIILGDVELEVIPDECIWTLGGLTAMSRKWFRLDEPDVLAAQMAAFNYRFRQIFPFDIGNEIVGWIIIAHQSKHLFVNQVWLGRSSIDISDYRVALTVATWGYLTPLAFLILDHASMSNPCGEMETTVMPQAIRDLRERRKIVDTSN